MITLTIYCDQNLCGRYSSQKQTTRFIIKLRKLISEFFLSNKSSDYHMILKVSAKTDSVYGAKAEALAISSIRYAWNDVILQKLARASDMSNLGNRCT